MTSRMPSARTKGETTRRAVMDAAFRVFAAKGFLRAQIIDIAREAGKSTGVVYIYFRNKEAILDAWMDECDAATPWYQADTGLLFEKARPFILYSYWSLYERYGPIMDAIEAAALVSDHFRARLIALQDRGRDGIARMIRHARSEGRCTDIDPDLTAHAIAALLSSTTAHWFRHRAALTARGMDAAATIANLETLYHRMLDEPRDLLDTAPPVSMIHSGGSI